MDQGRIVTVVNPATGDVLFPARGYQALVAERPKYAKDDGRVWVKIVPSGRIGVEYDLNEYPADWVVPA
jgi:hypothetical protein